MLMPWDIVSIAIGVLAALLLMPVLFHRLPGIVLKNCLEYRWMLVLALDESAAPGQDLLRDILYYRVVTLPTKRGELGVKCHAIREVLATEGPRGRRALEMCGWILRDLGSQRPRMPNAIATECCVTDMKAILALLCGSDASQLGTKSSERDIEQVLRKGKATMSQAVEVALTSIELIRIADEMSRVERKRPTPRQDTTGD